MVRPPYTTFENIYSVWVPFIAALTVEFCERDIHCLMVHVIASPLTVLHLYPAANKWQVSWSSLSKVAKYLVPWVLCNACVSSEYQIKVFWILGISSPRSSSLPHHCIDVRYTEQGISYFYDSYGLFPASYCCNAKVCCL